MLEAKLYVPGRTNIVVVTLNVHFSTLANVERVLPISGLD